MSCKYKYKDSWYSKQELQELLYKERGVTKEGKLIKPSISDNNPVVAQITKENTTSIESVKSKLDSSKGDFLDILTTEEVVGFENENGYLIVDYSDNILPKSLSKKVFKTFEEAKKELEKFTGNISKKEYTSQAETNLKVAALKEVARKYPRSLITSKVVPINPNMVDNSEIQYSKVENIQDLQNEINQLKQELERVEKEGFAALSPIYKFYEETIGNILKKQYKNQIKEITDEYGNEWYELSITPEQATQAIKFQSPNLQYTGDLANQVIPSNGPVINNDLKIPQATKVNNFVYKSNPEINPYKFTKEKGGYPDIVSRLKSRLITLNVADKNMKIKDNSLFNKLQDSWTNQAEKLYNLISIPKVMIEEEGKVKFRDYLFNEIDYKNGVITESNKTSGDKVKLEEAGISQQNINHFFNNYFNESHTYSDGSSSQPVDKEFSISSFIEFINKRQRTNLDSNSFNSIGEYINELNRIALEPNDISIGLLSTEEINKRSCKI